MGLRLTRALRPLIAAALLRQAVAISLGQTCQSPRPFTAEEAAFVGEERLALQALVSERTDSIPSRLRSLVSLPPPP